MDVFSQDRAAFMPYFTLGYPDMETSLDVIEACSCNGADIIELGVPFSDPLADGPTIQHSTQIALQNGVSVAKCLDGVRNLRLRGLTIPLLLMGYYNPILAYGLEKFVQDSFSEGVHGFIIPDLPPDEAEVLASYCQQSGMALPFLLSPNSSEERITLVTGKSTGFVYLVSVTGITGSRQSLPDNLRDFIGKVKSMTDKPVAVGFGISTPEQAYSVGEMADGVIVGSALIKAAKNGAAFSSAAGAFTKQMTDALQSTP
ncbi:MAG: tryptophan synthase subunit alpha [Anaerolineales bacterium]